MSKTLPSRLQEMANDLETSGLLKDRETAKLLRAAASALEAIATLRAALDAWKRVLDHTAKMPTDREPLGDWLDERGPLLEEATTLTKLYFAEGQPDAPRSEPPILSKYHGQRGFELERFIKDYEAWTASIRR